MCVPCPRSHPSSSTSSKPKRSRTKTRRPKFLSLRRHLSAASASASTMPPPPPPPDPHVDDPHVVSLLDPVEDDAGGSLTALLGAASATAAGSDSASPPSSASMNWDGQAAIARRALRGRERWVFCCCGGGGAGSPASEQEACSGGDVELLWCGERKGLSLKLDYEEILTAWSDKGSFYIEKVDPQGHQVVPEVYQYHACDAAAPAVFVDVGRTGGAGNLWRVPEASENKAVEVDGREGRVSTSSNCREERVKRYKEKRQNRLFSKRIRYEVRKLNAEKRPRMKGRFVKRMDDV